MIDYIKGRLVDRGPGWIIVESQGIGYKIEVPTPIGTDNWVEGNEINVYTRLIIKEEAVFLYGFSGAEERNLFNLITSVSGFGPRMALSTLGLISASKFYVAILEEDVKTLCNIPGIGKKTAQRLILELKEKLPQAFPSMPTEFEGEIAGQVSSGNLQDEAIDALCSLGYSNTEAMAAIGSIPDEEKEANSTEGLIKIALKKLASR